MLTDSSETQAVEKGSARDTSAVTWKIHANRDGNYKLTVESSKGQTQSQNVTIRAQGKFD